MNPKLKISSICSPEAYEWLKKYIATKRKNFPYNLKPQHFFYKNTNHRMYKSKFIDSVICSILKYKGFDPVTAEDKGKLIDNEKTYTDGLGYKRKIGGKKWVPQAKVAPGRADVKCYMQGEMYNMEIKVGSDRMSDKQIKERERALKAGEKYAVIKTVDDFMNLCDEIGITFD